jgi:molybdate transport system ATP-binding protein
MSLEVDVEHARGSFRLTARFSAAPGLTALFGRSGSGKTTLVDIVGGLVRPDRGRIAIDGQVLVDTATGVFVPSHRRHIGYVFQDSRLFPHLNVRRNLLYGRWIGGRWFGRDAVDGATADLGSVVDLLGIGPLLERRPASLSGGEKQRVAIGRALLSWPRLLLMDEPLAALDEARRAEILPYIERLRDEAGVPILYVSHAVAEVARLATTVVLLSDGRVTAVGPVGDVLSLADPADVGSVLDATVARHDEAFQLSVLATPAGELQVPRLQAMTGAAVRAYIRARDVMLSLQPPEEVSALNVLAGHILEITPTSNGAQADVKLDCNGTILVSRITTKSVQRLALSPGRPVFAVIKSVSFERT